MMRARPTLGRLRTCWLPTLRAFPRVVQARTALFSMSHWRLYPSDDAGGKYNTGQHRTVYDDFFNILQSSDSSTTISISSTSPTSLTLTDGLVVCEAIVILNNHVFLFDHPPLNQDYAVPSGIGWEHWIDQPVQAGSKLQVTRKVGDVFKVFELVDERPEIILFGTGKRVLPPPGPVREWIAGLGIQLDVQSTVSIHITSHCNVTRQRESERKITDIVFFFFFGAQ